MQNNYDRKRNQQNYIYLCSQMRKIREYKILITTIWLLGTAIIFASNTFFTHTHILADNTVVTHSHFYHHNSDKSTAGHSHSNKQFQLIALNSFFAFLISFTIPAIFIIHTFSKTTYFYNFIEPKQLLVSKNRGRAPPFIY